MLVGVQHAQAYEQREQHVAVVGEEQAIGKLGYQREHPEPERVPLDVGCAAVSLDQQEGHDGKREAAQPDEHA